MTGIHCRACPHAGCIWCTHQGEPTPEPPTEGEGQ